MEEILQHLGCILERTIYTYIAIAHNSVKINAEKTSETWSFEVGRLSYLSLRIPLHLLWFHVFFLVRKIYAKQPLVPTCVPSIWCVIFQKTVLKLVLKKPWNLQYSPLAPKLQIVQNKFPTLLAGFQPNKSNQPYITPLKDPWFPLMTQTIRNEYAWRQHKCLNIHYLIIHSVIKLPTWNTWMSQEVSKWVITPIYPIYR